MGCLNVCEAKPACSFFWGRRKHIRHAQCHFEIVLIRLIGGVGTSMDGARLTPVIRSREGLALSKT